VQLWGKEVKYMKEKIVELLKSVKSNRNLIQVFHDWTAIMAINIANSVDTYHLAAWNKREREYQHIISRYNYEEQRKFVEAMSLLKEELNHTLKDILGKIYCDIGANDKNLGQFFTPEHIGSLISDMAIDYETEKDVVLTEPCCGSGSLTIGVISEIKEHWTDYRERIYVMAQDIDWNCVYMIYVQLSLMEMKAVITQGDFLKDEILSDEQIFYTPEYAVFAAEKAGIIKADNQ